MFMRLSKQVCSELEEEKRKHAQDTAQGDDVTYMLEKERERLRQEVRKQINNDNNINSCLVQYTIVLLMH